MRPGHREIQWFVFNGGSKISLRFGSLVLNVSVSDDWGMLQVEYEHVGRRNGAMESNVRSAIFAKLAR